MSRKPAPPGHYTATEAAEKLGISVPMLYNHVRSGNLQRIVPKGRKQGFFLQSEVEKLRIELYSFLETGQIQEVEVEPEKEVYHFLPTTKREDLVECAAIAKEVYGSEGTPVDTRLAWMEKNPEILYVVKSDHNVGGYVYILPLQRETIDAILRDERSLASLTQDEIQSFTPEEPIDIYLMSVATRPELARQEKRILSAQVLAGLMNVLRDLAQRGVVIRSLIARSRLPDGIRLLNGMEFDHYPIEIPDKRFSYFIIELDKSNAKFIQRYKQTLRRTQEG